jgi:hypothetical protein
LGDLSQSAPDRFQGGLDEARHGRAFKHNNIILAALPTDVMVIPGTGIQPISPTSP